MTPKILVADDSPTIQKVIGITLASENFELIKCEEEDSLNDLVKEHKPDLVLLDYNLSEALTGYDLVQNIRNIHDTRIIFLYGTFDTIDESLNKQFNIDGSMVKPFDAKKFIHLCRDTIALSDDAPISSGAANFEAEELEDFEDYTQSDPDATDKFELGEDWQVNQPQLSDMDELTSEDVISNQEKNELEAGMADWGMAVPGVIDKTSTDAIDLPPVIDEESKGSASFVEITNDPTDVVEEPVVQESTVQESASSSEDVIPSDQDLEYPDMDLVKEQVSEEKDAPQLVSMEELNETEDTTPAEGIEITATAGTDTIEEVQALEEQIADEVSDEDDIWSADEVVEDPDAHRFYTDETQEVEGPGRRTEDTQPHIQKPINTEVGEKTDPMINPLLTAKLENVNETVKENLDPVIERIVGEELDKIIENIVREEAQKAIEKVAWDIIPDLAENIIKEQLGKLADDVISES